MTPDEMQDKAIDLFLKRLHCSQVLATVGLEKLGKNEPEVIRALGSFGGGIGGTGHVCGALVGAVSVVGALYSRTNLEEKENPRIWALTKAVMEKFEALTAEYGGINCAQIAQVDWMDWNQVKNFYRNPESRRQVCVKVVGETAKMLGELLEEEQGQIISNEQDV